MHLIESYALNSGVKISKPYIREKFFPLKVDKYITFQPWTKFDSRNYDSWQEVLDFLVPLLLKQGIFIVQIGGKKDKQFKNVYQLSGQTTLNQTAYVIKNGLLHLGIDSLGVHLASYYDKKIVGIYSNMLPSQSGPFFSSTENLCLIESDKKGNKPSYSTQENPKTINNIGSEKIARAVLNMLNLETLDFPYETIYTGETYQNKMIESVPSSIIDHEKLGMDSIIMRMDFHFNENALVSQLKRCPCSVITDWPIDLEILKAFKSRILQFFLYINDDVDLSFLDSLKELGIEYALRTQLEEKDLQKHKLNLLDHPPVFNQKIIDPKDIPELKNEDLNNLYYVSKKFTLEKGKIYPSCAAWQADQPVSDFTYEPQKIINNDSFWRELESFKIFRKI
jgi:hypothetical protein